jgi:diaminopimelate epimerase
VKIHFSKYQATGNDFVLIDNRSGQYSFTKEQIKQICHRHFGVGADGVMLIERHPSLDFNLVYYNSDGSQSLCGNGSRAAVHMAARLGLVNGKTRFNAYDGIHEAELFPDGVVKLRMNDVNGVKQIGDDLFINTGSPHYIRFIGAIESYPVYEEGKKIRYNEHFKPGGTNVNFVEPLQENIIFVRTYERGVEDETLSCGTGVAAAALAASFRGYTSPVRIETLGGQLTVQFNNGSSSANPAQNTTNIAEAGSPAGQAGTFTDIFLIGPAKLVFEGDLEL